jgi:flagellar basal-body rod protein FlgF
MMDAMTATSAAMQNDVERLRVTSHNLANLTTVGFKREISVTRPFLDQLNDARGATTVAGQGQDVQTTTTDYRAGAIKYTASPLDVAIEGSAFFVVSTEAGEAYTRQGNFQVDVSGRLVAAGGLPVLGVDGGEIRVGTSQPRIDQAGNVSEAGNVVGRIRLVNVADLRSLERLGNGLFAATDSTEFSDPDAGRLRQGYLEAANVVSMNEMIKMIETVRHFETSQRLLKGYDNMLDRAINQLGEL